MNRPATILVADDDPNDVLILKRAFKRAGMANPVHVVGNGGEAIEYLKGAMEARASGSSVPLLILLDLNMPLMSGFEVLGWIRAEPRLKEIPVVINSQSKDRRDINRAYHLGANSYLVKPSNFEGLVGMMEIIKGMIKDVELEVKS